MALRIAKLKQGLQWFYVKTWHEFTGEPTLVISAIGKSHQVSPLVVIGKGGIFKALLRQLQQGQGHRFNRS